jgi:hypothetical protein
MVNMGMMQYSAFKGVNKIKEIAQVTQENLRAVLFILLPGHGPSNLNGHSVLFTIRYSAIKY